MEWKRVIIRMLSLKVFQKHLVYAIGQILYGMTAAAGAYLGLLAAEQAAARHGTGKLVPRLIEHVDVEEASERMRFL